MGPFGGLIGGNDYGYGEDTAQAGGNLNSAGSNYGAETAAGQTNMGNWGQDSNAYRQSMTNLAQQYGQAPTQQQEAQVLGNENADVATAYGKARARLMSDSASRGIDSVGNQGGVSSTLGGGLASLGQSYADTLGQNATNYYNQYQSPQATDARLAQQGGIYGQLASGDWSQGMGALNDAAQGYSNLGQDWSKMADTAGQMDESNSQMWNGLFTPLAQGAGQGLGGLIGDFNLGGGGDTPAAAPASVGGDGWTPASPTIGSADDFENYLGGTSNSTYSGLGQAIFDPYVMPPDQVADIMP